jgi:hypothetical protein
MTITWILINRNYLGQFPFVKLCLGIFFLVFYLQTYAQVLNITQAGVIEGGYGAVPNLNGASSVFINDNYAYVVGTGDVLQILDITLPALPIHKGSLANGVGGANILRPQSVVVSGDYAYITSYGGNALEIVDVSDPANPVHAATLKDGGGVAPFLNQPWGLAVVGNYAYVVSNQSNALEIIDITNPVQPVHAGSLIDGEGSAPFLNNPISIAISGHYALIGLGSSNSTNGGLEIIDIANPATPLHKGYLADGGGSPPYLKAIYSVNIQGNYAYMTDQISSALEIVDITDPALPVHKGSLLGSSFTAASLQLVNPFSVAVSGNYAYVVGQANSGLNIVDISNPAQPIFVNAAFPGLTFSSRSIFIKGNKAYVASRAGNSLSTVDITMLPVNLISTIKSGAGGALLTEPKSIFVSGNYAYVASRLDRALEILDISRPSLPSHTASIVNGVGGAIISDPMAVVVGGNYAYVANSLAASLSVIDVSNPALPIYKINLSLIANGTVYNANDLYYPNDLFLLGNYLYVVCGDPFSQNFVTGSQNVLLIFDVSNPTLPVLRGKLADGTGGAIFKRPNSVYVRGDHAYITGFESNSLEIVNISNPNAPTHQASIIHGTNGALLDKPSAVYISDLSGSTNSGTPASAGVYALVVSGYSADGSGSNALEIINVTNPSSPIHLSSLTDNNGEAPYLFSPTAIQVSGDYAYVSSYNSRALEIINVSNPASPFHEGALLNGQNNALMDSPTDLFINGSYVYTTIGGLYNAVNVAFLYGPSILSFSPASASPNTTVTITGKNFNTFLKASINGKNAPVSKISETSLTITIPPEATIGKITLNYSGQTISSLDNVIIIPTAYSPSSLGQTSFTANWSDVGANVYYLDVSTDNFSTFLPGYDSLLLTNQTSVLISGLQPGTLYQYRVRAQDQNRLSLNSNVISIRTTPNTPETIQATQISQTSFSANWAPVANADGYYLDVVSDNDSFTNNFLVGYTNLNIAGSANTSQFVSGLSPFTNYYYRVRAYNSSGTSTNSTTMQVQTVDDVAPVISPASAPNATTIVAGFSPTFTIRITDNVGVDSAKLFYRGIANPIFKSADLQPLEGTQGFYSIVVQGIWLDELGIEYFFRARDKAGNITRTSSTIALRASPSISFPALPVGKLVTDYRIVAFPYRLSTDNKITSVYNGVPWTDKTKASIWWWDPSLQNNAGDYVQHTTTSTLQTIDAGKGYWVLLSDPFTPQLANITSPNYSQSNLFSMTLKPGWNQVGNPYPVDINWDDVIAFNTTNNPTAIFSSLYSFDGSVYKQIANNESLKAFEGGFVRNLGSSDIIIKIPFADNTARTGRSAKHEKKSDDDTWESYLYIEQNKLINKLGGFGMYPNAKNAIDRFDNFNPPAFVKVPEINFSKEMYEDNNRETLSKDIVSVQEKYQWQFTPTADLDQPARLIWNAESLSGVKKDIYLFDQERLMLIDMKTVGEYSFTVSINSNFKILFGNSDVNFSEQTQLAGRPYPNPLSKEGLLTFPIALADYPGDYNITLVLYNAVGQIVLSASKNLEGGLHQIAFDVNNNSLPSGMILYTLTIESERGHSFSTGKIVKQ